MRISDWSSDVCSSDLRGAGFGVRGPACGADQYPGAGHGRTSQALRLMQQGRRLAPAALSFVAQSFTARGLEVEARLQLGQVDVHVLDLEAAVLAAQRERVGEAVLQAEAIGRVGAAVVAGAGQAGDRGVQVPALAAGLGVAGELRTAE